MLVDDPLADGEAEPRAPLLGGEEGVEDPGSDLLGYPRTRIADDDFGELPSPEPGFDHQRSAPLHRLDGIDKSIHEDSLDPLRIGEDRRKAVGQVLRHPDLLQGQLVSDEAEGLFKESVEVAGRLLQLMGLAEDAEVLDDALYSEGIVVHPLEIPAQRGARREVLEDQVSRHQDARQRIIQLVGNPAGQEPERGQLFGLKELLVLLPQLVRPLSDPLLESTAVVLDLPAVAIQLADHGIERGGQLPDLVQPADLHPVLQIPHGDSLGPDEELTEGMQDPS